MTTVVVETQPEHLYATTVIARTHAIVADEPPPAGEDLGFSPYELLLAALGTCTAMTLEMYARRKGWPLESVHVRLTFERIHCNDAADCGDAPAPLRMVDRITREIELRGPLEDAQRNRMMEIAAKCPVHRTLTGRPTIVDRLVPPGGLALEKAASGAAGE